MRRTQQIKRLLLGALVVFGLTVFHGSGDTLLAQSSSAFKVVVHATNPVSSMPKAEVSKLFLKKVTKWQDKSKVQPVDQVGNPVRERFSNEVHGQDIASTKRYWQQIMFSGRARPPKEVASDKEVLDFVRANPLAIGYVSVNAALGDGVKILQITE